MSGINSKATLRQAAPDRRDVFLKDAILKAGSRIIRQTQMPVSLREESMNRTLVLMVDIYADNLPGPRLGELG